MSVLTFKVIRHSIGSEFTDGRPRVGLKCVDADAILCELRIPVDSFDDYPLNGELRVELWTVGPEDAAYSFMVPVEPKKSDVDMNAQHATLADDEKV